MTTAQTQQVTRSFEHSILALEEYDRTAASREHLWDKIRNKADLHVAEAADKEAESLVQHAFWEDTKGVNSRENCRLVSPAVVRRMVAGLPTR